jgi:hypothetical protein
MQVVRSKLMTVLSSQRPQIPTLFLAIYPKTKWLQSLHLAQPAQNAHLQTSTNMVAHIRGMQSALSTKQSLTPKLKQLVR